MSVDVDKKIKAIERAKTWREIRREKGLCPKHSTRLASLARCFACRPDNPLTAPKTGDKLKECFLCATCGRCYHEGSIYHHINARKRRGIQPGPRGSLLNFDKRDPNDPDRVLSLCGECRKEKGGEWEYRKYFKWRGLCPSHVAEARRRGGDVFCPHNGATVHLSERVPEPGQRKRLIRIKFTCGNPDKPTHKGITFKSSALDKGGKPRLEWQGRCSECLGEAGAPTKITDDREVTGAVVYLSQEKNGLVPVFYKNCQHRLELTREKALRYLYEPPRKGYCQTCFKDPNALRRRLMELVLLEAGGSKNLRPDQPAVDAIAAVWARVREATLPFEKRLKLVTGIEIAKEMHLGTPGSGSSADQVREKLTNWGVRDKYKGPGQWLPKYVKDTVLELEQTRV
jgi:hypothetical protein